MNVWVALALEHHVHRQVAKDWWTAEEGLIAFTRFTQIGLLRLLTTSAAMDGKPLRMNEAWRVYDRMFDDDRLVLVPEPVEVEPHFRKQTSAGQPAPRLWADAWLLAVAASAGGVLVSFDKALASRGAHCLLA